MALNWSFKARLHNTTDAMKKRYVNICDQIRAYSGVKTTESWDKVRISMGKKTCGVMYFHGQTLCLALALDPTRYLHTKFICEDVSDTAKFEATPLLTRMSSDRQVTYLKELLDDLFVGVVKNDVVKSPVDIPYHTEEELIEMGLIKTGAAKEKAAAPAAPAPAAVEESAPAEEPVSVEEPVVEAVAEPEPVAEEPVVEEAAPVEEPAPAKEPVVEAKPEPVVEAKPAPVKKPAAKPAPAPAPAAKPARHASARTNIVNVGTLAKHFADGQTVTVAALREKGLVGGGKVKVLGGGSLETKLHVEVNKISCGAAHKIEAAGGSVKLVK